MMPERCRIHSSDVSIRRDSRRLSTTLAGRCIPVPRITVRMADSSGREDCGARSLPGQVGSDGERRGVSSRPELSPDLQEPSELQRVADGESLPVVVEVDVNIHSVPQPFPDEAGPASQLSKREFTVRAGSRVHPEVTDPPSHGRAVRLYRALDGDAERDAVAAEKLEDRHGEPALVPEFQS